MAFRDHPLSDAYEAARVVTLMRCGQTWFGPSEQCLGGFEWVSALFVIRPFRAPAV